MNRFLPILACLFLLVMSRHALAVTFHASTTGSDTNCTTIQNAGTPAATIQFAVDCLATAGDVVEIRGGVYNQMIDIVGKSGVNGNPMIIRAATGEVVQIDGTGVNPGGQFDGMIQFFGTISDFHIEQIQCINADQSIQSNTPCFAAYNNVSGTTLNRVLIDGVLINGTKGHGLEFKGPGVTNVTIRNSTVKNFMGNIGLFIRDASNIALVNNTIDNTGNTDSNSAIRIDDTVNVVIQGGTFVNTCRGVRIEGPGSPVSDRVLVSGVRMSNPETPSLCQVPSQAHLIWADGGTVAPGHGNLTVIASEIFRTDGAGIKIENQMHNVRVVNNTIFDTVIGIRDLSHCAGPQLTGPVEFINNIVDSLRSNDGIVQENKGDLADITINNNLLRPVGASAYRYDTDGDDNCPSTNTSTFTVAAFESSTGKGQNSLDSDPLLVNPASNVFNLQSGSPAIDAGVHIMTTTGSGTATTSVPVSRDPQQFFADPSDFYEFPSNTATVQVGTSVVDITSMTSTTITVATPITFGTGNGVHLPFGGLLPDLGALEAGVAVTPTPRRRVGRYYFR